MLAAHVGMRIRLLETLDNKKCLAKNAEGTIVRILHDPVDDALVEQAWAENKSSKTIYLTKSPLGVWLRMDGYKAAPFVETLLHNAPSLDHAGASALVFLEPTTTRIPFTWRDHLVQRTGFRFSHGCVRTSTACQGKTLKGGVIVDAGAREQGAHPMDDDTLWLHLYVMMSRATALTNLLLARAPPAEFLLRGPPRDLLSRLEMFARRHRLTCSVT